MSFIFILSILAILFFINKRQFWVYGFWSFFVLLTGTILKFTVERPRPVASVDGFSFPSMHVLTFAVLIVLINYIKTNKLIKTISCLLIISMMASRIYLHAHFFSDTLASILIILIFSQILTLYDKQKVFFYENEK
ncbi:phosphatase PAP2 family protein [Staphylococcus equorum]|uniref:phosphatase PAP2 family protein n=1 Tax=Staphylococcus equorum TaxID=246432 RepID=UPI0034E5AFD6